MAAYTEEEARTRWCPFARDWDGPPNGSGVASINRNQSDGSPVLACMCIGSDCMAWRWRDTIVAQQRRGFCGLAGHHGLVGSPR